MIVEQQKLLMVKKKFNLSVENKIHKESFIKIKKELKKKYPNLKVSFKIMKV